MKLSIARFVPQEINHLRFNDFDRQSEYRDFDTLFAAIDEIGYLVDNYMNSAFQIKDI